MVDQEKSKQAIEEKVSSNSSKGISDSVANKIKHMFQSRMNVLEQIREEGVSEAQVEEAFGISLYDENLVLVPSKSEVVSPPGIKPAKKLLGRMKTQDVPSV